MGYSYCSSLTEGIFLKQFKYCLNASVGKLYVVFDLSVDVWVFTVSVKVASGAKGDFMTLMSS